jgi:hypothetical protein
MGADIHMFVEYKHKDSNDWRSFGGRISVRRNYTLFGLLADVRGKGVIYPQRGLPDDISYETKGYAYYFIAENPAQEERAVSIETAKEWEAKYESKIIYRDGKPTWVQHPDWHSYSWLTTKEFRAVLKKYNREIPKDFAEFQYEAILSVMAKLGKHGQDVRVVFWFDN